MGWDRSPATAFPTFTVASVVKVTFSGSCPMCGTSFSTVFSGEKDGLLHNEEGLDEYRCPCGYFTFYPDSGDVLSDNHNIQESEWKKRLATAVAPQS